MFYYSRVCQKIINLDVNNLMEQEERLYVGSNLRFLNRNVLILFLIFDLVSLFLFLFLVCSNRFKKFKYGRLFILFNWF